ncbi:hypothetical protein EMIT0111MI5_110191 [Burkholderia sp. IT-111MI5]
MPRSRKRNGPVRRRTRRTGGGCATPSPAWRACRPDRIGEAGATDFSVVNAALQSYGVDVPGVPVTVTSFALDVTIEPEKLTAPGPGVSCVAAPFSNVGCVPSNTTLFCAMPSGKCRPFAS